MGTSSRVLSSSPHPSWRDLYIQALFEADRTKADARIAKAEQALLRRERELFGSAQRAGERDAVNAALHSLRLLRTCLAGRHSASAA